MDKKIDDPIEAEREERRKEDEKEAEEEAFQQGFEDAARLAETLETEAVPAPDRRYEDRRLAMEPGTREDGTRDATTALNGFGKLPGDPPGIKVEPGGRLKKKEKKSAWDGRGKPPPSASEGNMLKSFEKMSNLSHSTELGNIDCPPGGFLATSPNGLVARREGEDIATRDSGMWGSPTGRGAVAPYDAEREAQIVEMAEKQDWDGILKAEGLEKPPPRPAPPRRGGYDRGTGVYADLTTQEREEVAAFVGLWGITPPVTEAGTEPVSMSRDVLLGSYPDGGVKLTSTEFLSREPGEVPNSPPPSADETEAREVPFTSCPLSHYDLILHYNPFRMIEIPP